MNDVLAAGFVQTRPGRRDTIHTIPTTIMVVCVKAQEVRSKKVCDDGPNRPIVSQVEGPALRGKARVR